MLKSIQQRAVRRLPDPERLGEGRQDEGGVPQGSKRYKDYPVRERFAREPGRLDGQPGPAGAPRAGQGAQAAPAAVRAGLVWPTPPGPVRVSKRASSR